MLPGLGALPSIQQSPDAMNISGALFRYQLKSTKHL
jgi:hypothetical protein